MRTIFGPVCRNETKSSERLGREQVELFVDPDDLTSRATGICIDTIRQCDDPVLKNTCCIAGNPARKKRFSSNDDCSTSDNKAAVTQEKGKRGRRTRNASESKVLLSCHEYRFFFLGTDEELNRIFKTKEASEVMCASGAAIMPNHRLLEETPKSRKSYEFEVGFKLHPK
ncbi:hypothetical protein ANCCAN_06194 [Ancylostoma caninum]|uniref:Uncharacterized protein n=1 Tax=Ancylostoma caninum TaxID=29170 RepID=A0A368GXJ0_ANCCA|nr:hypothetical protein ANCCAN_06194 [Ancylostoma caninum]